MPTINIRSVDVSGADFTSRRAWILGRAGNYVALDIIEKAEIYAFGDTLNFTIDGLTTDATRYPWLYVLPSQRHAGKWDATKARLEYTPTGTFQTVVRSNEDYMLYEGDQLSLNPNGSANSGCSLIFLTAQTATLNKSIFNRLICRAIAGGTSIQGGFYTNNANPNVIFAACIFYDFTTSAAAYCRDGGTDLRWYNCTFHNSSFGIDSTNRANVVIAKNCLFKSVTVSCQGTFAAGTDYNATSNASMGYTVTGGGNTHDRVSQTFTFVDEAGDDFHLASTDTGASGFGVDLSADTFYAFNYDIDGDTITGLWPIGADKYVAAGSSVTHALASGIEANSTLSVASIARAEVLSALSQQNIVAVESPSGLVTVSRSASTPIEALQYLQRVGQTTYTVLQGLSVAPSGQLEVISTVILTRGAALEAGLVVQKSSPSAVELLRALSAARSSPIEFIGVAVFPTYEALEMALTDYDATTMLLRDRDGVDMTLIAVEAIH